MVSFPESIILANCQVCHTISTNSNNFYGGRHVFFILPNRVDVCHILHFLECPLFAIFLVVLFCICKCSSVLSTFNSSTESCIYTCTRGFLLITMSVSIINFTGIPNKNTSSGFTPKTWRSMPSIQVFQSLGGNQQ